MQISSTPKKVSVEKGNLCPVGSRWMELSLYPRKAAWKHWFTSGQALLPSPTVPCAGDRQELPGPSQHRKRWSLRPE